MILIYFHILAEVGAMSHSRNRKGVHIPPEHSLDHIWWQLEPHIHMSHQYIYLLDQPLFLVPRMVQNRKLQKVSLIKNPVTYLTLITYMGTLIIYVGSFLQLRFTSVGLIEFVHLQWTTSLIWKIQFIVSTTICNWCCRKFKQIWGSRRDSSGSLRSDIMVTGPVLGPDSLVTSQKCFWWSQTLLIPDQPDPLNMGPDLWIKEYLEVSALLNSKEANSLSCIRSQRSNRILHWPAIYLLVNTLDGSDWRVRYIYTLFFGGSRIWHFNSKSCKHTKNCKSWLTVLRRQDIV